MWTTPWRRRPGCDPAWPSSRRRCTTRPGRCWRTAIATRLLAGLIGAGATLVEEIFDPALVVDTPPPAPLAARDRRVIAVGSFSKALFPGLRVGWLAGPRELVERVTAVKRATDLSGSPFLEATAWALCRRGELDAQLDRLRREATTRRRIVTAALGGAPAGVRWSAPRGAFSLMVGLPAGWSSREVAARAAALGVWVLPGPTMSVSGRDDVLRAGLRRGGREGAAARRRVLRERAPARAGRGADGVGETGLRLGAWGLRRDG